MLIIRLKIPRPTGVVMTVRKYGNELNVGDTINVWWSPGQDVIKRFTDYTGPYKMQREFLGARIAKFTVKNLSMTVLAEDIFEVQEI
jgi:hypothetical protein